MTTITKDILKDRDIAIFKVVGEFTRVQIIDTVNKFYGPDFPKTVIWELSGADMSSINENDIRRIIDVAKKYEHLRKGGKTAFVQSSDMGFGLTRMYETLAKINDFTIPLRVFRNIDDAMSWVCSKKNSNFNK